MIASILFALFCVILAAVSFGLGWRRRGSQVSHEAARRFERGEMCWWCSMLATKEAPTPGWQKRVFAAIDELDREPRP